METYAIWNPKGGVGKSYLTFQLSCEYARQHPEKTVLVIDMGIHADVSAMLLGGLAGDQVLDGLYREVVKSGKSKRRLRRRSIAGYISVRTQHVHANPGTGEDYAVRCHEYNPSVPDNLLLVPGDPDLVAYTAKVHHVALNHQRETLEEAGRARAPRGYEYESQGNSWRAVHTWIIDLIADIVAPQKSSDYTVFLDCGSGLSIFTELALSASNKLIIPFTVDGSSQRAIDNILDLIYFGNAEFSDHSGRARLSVPKIWGFIANRLTRYETGEKIAAQAFHGVETRICEQMWDVYTKYPGCFHDTQAVDFPEFKSRFHSEMPDANSASVISTCTGIPIPGITVGYQEIPGAKPVLIGAQQLRAQKPWIVALAKSVA